MLPQFTTLKITYFTIKIIINSYEENLTPNSRKRDLGKEYEAKHLYHSIAAEFKELSKAYKDQLIEIVSNFEITDSIEVIKLFNRPELYEFGIFKNFNSNKGDVIGMSIIRSNKNIKSTLRIHLPYLNREKCTKELIELILKLNEPLKLNFRDAKQISEKITHLINVTFDDPYMDTNWIMEHSYYSYRVSSSKK